MRWTIFLSLVLIQIALTINKFTKTCKSKSLYISILYLLHHTLDVFLFWSFLFLTTRFEFIVHLLLVIGVGIHWFTYKNRCILTVMMNRECGYPEDDWLDSLKNMFGLRNISEYFHFIWIGLLAVQDILNI